MVGLATDGGWQMGLLTDGGWQWSIGLTKFASASVVSCLELKG